MGVLACDRYKCENIMCDLLSYNFGYICGECFGELVESGYKTDIEDFMNSPKRKTSKLDTAKIALELFSEEFQCRH